MATRLLSRLGLLLALALVVPAITVAAGEEEQRPKVVSFALPGSNGYGLLVLAQIPRGGEEEETGIGIFASRRDGVVTYGVPAKVSRRTIEADLGTLGRISVTRVVTDRTKTVPRGCAPGRTKRVRAQRYEGTIEFHGEEGFTELSATRAPVRYLPIECFGDRVGRPAGRVLPGAFLSTRKARFDESGRGVGLRALQGRPGARTSVSAEAVEVRGEVEVHRAAWARAGPNAMRYDRRLRTATVRPPAPFSGHGTYRRNAPRANRWTGNLTVDFPGRSNVRLTGRSFFASLEHPTR